MPDLLLSLDILLGNFWVSQKTNLSKLINVIAV